MKLSNILRNIFLVVAVLLTGFVLFVQCSGAKCFAVQSDSMMPTFRRGDIVVVRKTDFDALHEGDVISAHFPQGDGVFTHRILQIDTQSRQVTTRGDANMSDDPQVTAADRIIGKVWFSVPWVGFLSLYLQSRLVIYILAAVAIVLIAVRTGMQMRRKTDE